MKHHLYQGYSYVPVLEDDPANLDWINYDVIPVRIKSKERVKLDPLVVLEYLFQRNDLSWDNDYIVKPKPKIPTARVLIDNPIPEYLYPRNNLDWDNDYVIRPKAKLPTARVLIDLIPDWYDPYKLEWINPDIEAPRLDKKQRVIIDPFVIPKYLFRRDNLDWDNDYVPQPTIFKQKPIFNCEILSPQWYLEPRDLLDWTNDRVIQPVLPRWGYKVIFDHFYATLTLVYPKCVSSYMTEFPPPYGGRL